MQVMPSLFSVRVACFADVLYFPPNKIIKKEKKKNEEK